MFNTRHDLDGIRWYLSEHTYCFNVDPTPNRNHFRFRSFFEAMSLFQISSASWNFENFEIQLGFIGNGIYEFMDAF